MNYDIKKISLLRDEVRFSPDESDNERVHDRLWKSLSNGSQVLERSFFKISPEAEKAV